MCICVCYTVVYFDFIRLAYGIEENLIVVKIKIISSNVKMIVMGLAATVFVNSSKDDGMSSSFEPPWQLLIIAQIT